MFERYTDRARRTVALAQEIARSTGATEINSKHLLLALYDEGEGVAATVLSDLGFAREPILKNDDAQPGHIPFTQELKRILESGLREGLQLGMNYIGTEHLLLALTHDRNKGTPGYNALTEQIPANVVRSAVITKLKGYAEANDNKTDPTPLCACDHIWQHHGAAFGAPCDWRGCGCPRFVARADQ